MAVRLLHATAGRPGAIAILQLIGDAVDILRELTGVELWPLHRMRLVQFGSIDEGLAVRLTTDVAQLMPHGGPRVLQRLTQQLMDMGAVLVSDLLDHAVDPKSLYPEASDRFEALMLAALSRAQSPLAIDLLLDQPRRWRDFCARGGRLSEKDRARSARLNRLIDPPIVVLAGQPNVGKSTLSNALFGRAMSIAYDMPGTTRDYTAGWIDLAGLVVSWHDTPGMRRTSDPIEQRAIDLATKLAAGADLLVAMTDREHDWPMLPRRPDVWVLNKVDLQWQEGRARPMGGSHQFGISAKTGKGVPEFVAGLRDQLVGAEDLAHSSPWVFDQRLTQT